MTSDLTWSEPDVRYWCPNKAVCHETAVANESTDINMWISMAYHKLNNNKKRLDAYYKLMQTRDNYKTKHVRFKVYS